MKNLVLFLLLISSSAFGQKVILTPTGVQVHPVAIYYNTVQTYKGGCPSGMIGDSVSSVVIDKTYFSYLSQADANAQAIKAAKEGVDEMLECAYPSRLGFTSYPNPSTDYVFFSQYGDVEVSDMKGALLKTAKYVKAINLKDLAQGVYSIKFKAASSGKVTNIKQIKLQ